MCLIWNCHKSDWWKSTFVRYLLSAIRQQAIMQTNVDQNVCLYMPSLSHEEFINHVDIINHHQYHTFLQSENKNHNANKLQFKANSFPRSHHFWENQKHLPWYGVPRSHHKPILHTLGLPRFGSQPYKLNLNFSSLSKLHNYGPVMPYGDIELGQHWLR